jgi:hypothetical protein
MSTHKKQKSPGKGTNQTWASKRRINPADSRGDASAATSGAPFQEHDVQRRLGSFEGAGDHARTGSRGRQ